MPVCLGHAQNGKIETSAIVKIKLAGLVDDGLGIDGCAKIQAANRHAAHHSGFGRKGEQIGDFFFHRNPGNPFRHADAQIHDLVRTQFHRGAAGNDFACVQLHRGNALKGYANFGGICRVVGRGEGLRVVFLRTGDHHAINQHSRNLHLPRVQAAVFGQPLHLGDDDAAAVVHGHGNGQRFECERFSFHGQVAVGVGRGGADDADVDGEGLVEQVILAVNGQAGNPLIGCAGVEFSAAMTRIDEGIQPHTGQGAGFAGGNVTKQMGQNALGQIPGLDVIVDRKLLNLGCQAPVSANDAVDQSDVSKVVQSAVLAVTLSGGIYQRQVARGLCL